jgi:alpha-beta hydrolase superfamily lysophospholipase
VQPVEIRSAAGQKLATYFGAAERALLGFLHAPAEGSPGRAAGVVLCSPIGTDHTRSDWTYRHLAERLAAAGFPCLRFDLTGTGDSADDELGPGIVRRWIEDVGAAVRELRARSGVTTVALVGLRLGATLAMQHAAEQGDVDALVLWSPCVSGAALVSEITKLHKLYLRIEPHVATAPPPAADGEEALGIFLPRALSQELQSLDLLKTPRRPARRTLIIDGGNLPGRDALVARLRELDAGPELRSHPGQKFLVTVSHRQTLPAEVIGSVVGWLEEAYPAKGSPGPLVSRPSLPGPSAERPIVFGKGRLFGILTPADPAKARPERPAILVANAGCVNRQGPHRMFATLARRWARLGFDVLRMDLSGIGDSPAAPGTQENVTYPPSALGDLGEGIAALGGRKVIVAGLCSGGDYAFQLGARTEGIAGAWLLNPRTFTVLDLTAVEAGTPPAAGSVDDVPRALRDMATRGVDTLLLVSRGDPGVAYVDKNAGAAMAALSSAPGFQRFDIEGADHPFTPVTVQQRVGDLLSDHLIARYPA